MLPANHARNLASAKAETETAVDGPEPIAAHQHQHWMAENASHQSLSVQGLCCIHLLHNVVDQPHAI